MPFTWIDPPEVTTPTNLLSAIGGHPLITETLSRRGIRNLDQARAFLDPEYYSPTPAVELPGIEKATMRISRALGNGETILIWGDFDVDGQTSTTLLVEALRELGGKVKFHIPVRATEGHGIRVDMLEQILSQTPEVISLLLTCDTGIAAYDAVKFANEIGLDVIITDHHDLPETLPPAHAIVNPKLLPSEHPLVTLPGVGVVYKLIEALIEHQSLRSHLTEKYLDLVALGIVADVAEQLGDTRYLLQRGLKVLRQSRRLGLQTLMDLAEIIPHDLDEGHIGFMIAPRLNALGRLSDANPIVEFLTTDNPSRARILATHLEGLNNRRKLLTEQITQAALSQIDRNNLLQKQAVLVLAHPGWHTGVIGIVASRLVENFGKPAILLSIGDDGIARGSARSTDYVHITDAITTQDELLIGFGGHSGAAGLSLPVEKISQFKRGLEKSVLSQLNNQLQKPTIQIDAYIPLRDISLDLADEIGRLAPFGSGNPPLKLASRNLRMSSLTTIGHRKDHLKLVVEDEAGYQQDVLWWGWSDNPLPEAKSTFDLLYTLQPRTYRGVREPQVQWIDFRYAAESPPQLKNHQRHAIEVVDLRREENPIAVLKSIKTEYDTQIWVEGKDKSKLDGSDREELIPASRLVVWTTPPSHFVWKSVLERVKPSKLYLFSIDPQIDKLNIFLDRLAGLVKHVISTKEGKAHLEKLAASTSQQVNTVRMGLQWLEAKGFVQVRKRKESVLLLIIGSGVENDGSSEIEAELETMLAETAAFRAFFKKTPNNLT